LFRQEKNEKKPTQGALYVLLPQSNPPPCVSPGRIAVSAEHLNLDPVHSENVPIFCMKFGAVYTGRAARAAAAANSEAIRLKRLVVKVLGSFGGARRVGYIGEGGFDCGSKRLSASPMLSSLVTFLFSDKKVT